MWLVTLSSSQNDFPFSLPRPVAVQDKLDQMVFLWQDIQALQEEREAKLLDVMDLADKFWCDHCALLITTKDSQDLLKDLEEPGVDPSVVKQQLEFVEVRGIYAGKMWVSWQGWGIGLCLSFEFHERPFTRSWRRPCNQYYRYHALVIIIIITLHPTLLCTLHSELT